MLSIEQKERARRQDQMDQPSARSSKNHIRQTAGHRVIIPKLEGPSLWSKIMKTAGLLIFAILFVSIVGFIMMATVLYPFYALPALLAPAVSNHNKYLIGLGIPLFWVIAFIWNAIYIRRGKS